MHPYPVVKGKSYKMKFDKDGNIVFEPIEEVSKQELNKGWIDVRRFFPNVRSPLFHKTRGLRATGILKNGFDTRAEGYLGGTGVSFTRSFSWVEKPYLEGYFVFVIDKRDFSKSDFIPFSSPSVGDEFEERFIGERIPLKKIKGLIVLRPLKRYESHLKELPFPVVGKSKNGWSLVNNRLGERLHEEWKKGKLVSDKPALLRRCVVDVYKDGDEKGKKGIERAFAICYSSLQKHGLMKGNKLTKKGKKRSYVDDAKDREYEKIIQRSQEESTMGVKNMEKLLEDVRELSGIARGRVLVKSNKSLHEGAPTSPKDAIFDLKYAIDQIDATAFYLKQVKSQVNDTLKKGTRHFDKKDGLEMARILSTVMGAISMIAEDSRVLSSAIRSGDFGNSNAERVSGRFQRQLKGLMS